MAIEKHFILNKKQETPDSEFSIEPQQLRELIKVSNDCWQSLGSKSLKRSSFEIENKIFRRSLYFVKDLKAGEIITSDHIKRIRPGYGLAPKYIDKFLNKRSKIDVKRGDRVSWDVIDI